MAPRTIVLAAMLGLGLPSGRALAADGWGPSWSFGPTTSRIIYAKTTLVPGRVPTLGSAGPLFIWPGMSNPTSDLIQTTANAYANNGNSSYCGATASQWCVEASVFGSFGQRNGKAVAVDPDDHVTIEYKLESDNTTWNQTVTSQKLGKVISTLTSTSGQMPKGGFGFATEAQGESYTVDTQYYLCTELRFAEADPSFAKTGVGGTGANHGATGTASGPGTAKNIHTPDNGLTWLVDLITLPAMNPQGTQTPAPAYSCGSGGTGGTGGASGTGGGRADAGMGGSGTGGASVRGGAGGRTGGGGTAGTSGRGGSGGGAVGGNGTGGNGATTGSGGIASGSGGTGSGGAGSGGAVTGSGGTAGSSRADSGQGGNGGIASGTGGGSGAAGHGGAGTGGATVTSPTTTSGSSGCSCNVGQGGGSGGLLLLGTLLTVLSRRRRR